MHYFFWIIYSNQYSIYPAKEGYQAGVFIVLFYYISQFWNLYFFVNSCFTYFKYNFCKILCEILKKFISTLISLRKLKYRFKWHFSQTFYFLIWQHTISILICQFWKKFHFLVFSSCLYQPHDLYELFHIQKLIVFIAIFKK